MAEDVPGAALTTVRVRYFAALVDLAGTSEETLALPRDGATIDEVWGQIIARHPAFAAQRPYVRVARNTDFVQDDAVLASGDVVALLPPFSGG